MKRTVAILLAAIMLVGLLAACGGSKAAGSYKLESVPGEDMEELEAMASLLGIDLEDMFSLELKSDGTGSITAYDEVEEFTWKQNGDTITMTQNGDSFDATYSDGRITMDLEGEEMVFVKK